MASGITDGDPGQRDLPLPRLEPAGFSGQAIVRAGCGRPAGLISFSGSLYMNFLFLVRGSYLVIHGFNYM